MKMTKTQLQQIIKEELEAVMNESYTSGYKELDDLDEEVKEMLQSTGSLDQEILSKVYRTAARILKHNEKIDNYYKRFVGDLKIPYERMTDGNIRMLRLHVRKRDEWMDMLEKENGLEARDYTRAYDQHPDIEREYNKRGLRS